MLVSLCKVGAILVWLECDNILNRRVHYFNVTSFEYVLEYIRKVISWHIGKLNGIIVNKPEYLISKNQNLF